MRGPSQRRALGALFLVLAAIFAGIAVAAVDAALVRGSLWIVALAAAAIALWLGGLAAGALRR